MFAPRHLLALCLASLSLSSSFSVASPNLRFPYGSEKVRGVNIGGWLVLEPWITPSLFEAAGADVVDEWTYGAAAQTNGQLTAALTNHWNTFITQDDFNNIADAGLNHVRIPIGYWAFDVGNGEPYLTGQYPYLLKAVQWAANAGLKVLVDLHGVPGSQNGFDNSGRMGGVFWASSSSNVARTNSIVSQLAHEFSQAQYGNSVVAIAPINEPASFKSDAVLPAAKNLYEYAYAALRHPFAGSDTVGDLLLVIHDAFEDFSVWDGYMAPQGAEGGYQGVALDHHSYGVFSTPELQQDWEGHIQSKCQLGWQIGGWSAANLWLITGEWTVASTDCAKYLNGRGVGARYDGSFSGAPYVGSCGPKTGSATGFSADYKAFMRKNFEAQTSAYEQGSGWIFWTWKAENADDWSYQAGLDGGWIPWNPAEKAYGNQCGY